MRDIFGGFKPTEREETKGKNLGIEIVDYSKWAGAGRGKGSDYPAGKSIHSDEMGFISYCRVVSEFKKDKDAREINNSASSETKEEICSKICKLNCFLN
ncbi:MAG: hypothetical protein NT136_04205 [Candidatus Moranbacteria bacterium]|nr:hypothetical protein [Candidatus Moranbacteria bacterium]